MTPRGINQREYDVSRAFVRAIDRVIELAPDMVLVAGDVFHQVRPTNSAIIHAYMNFARLRAALPTTDVVIVAGNHDTPRSTETGSILGLFRTLGIHVVDGEARTLDFPDRDVSILAVPHVPTRPKLVPSGERRWNVLLMHAPVPDVYPTRAIPPELLVNGIPLADLHDDVWDYVALGEYHVYQNYGRRVFYSGSLEYTSHDSWGDLAEERERKIRGKGFIEHDLATGEHVFHHVPGDRVLLDLLPISARGLTTEEVNAAIAGAVNRIKGGIDEKIVRLVVRDIPRHVARQLDHKQIREFRKRALHFQLDTRKPDSIARQSSAGAPGRRATLEDLVRDKLRERVIPPDVDRDDLVDLGVQYLKDASEHESVSVLGAPAVEA